MFNSKPPPALNLAFTLYVHSINECKIENHPWRIDPLREYTHKKLHISVVYPKILPKWNYLQKNIDGISNFDKEVIIGLVILSLGSNYANE